MNIDKRYCQNRVRKRKRNIGGLRKENEDTDIEEERQFKLRRFVKDVHKFVEEKCQVEKPDMVCKPTTPLQIHKANKKVKPVKPQVNRGLFQNGIQTRFYCRDITQKEMTARLDENLQQIIALGNNKENECQCQHHCRKSTFLADEMTVARLPLLVLTPRSLSSPTKWESPELPSTITSIHRKQTVDRHSVTPPIKEFDSELYSEFIRIITISSSKSKSLQFKSKSYASAAKKKLLGIYLKGRKENCRETDEHKVSIGTSPLTEPQTSSHADSENSFSGINFVPEPMKSSLQFLEETIGPASSSNNMSLSPDQQQCYQPSQLHWLPEPRRPKYIHEPMPSFFKSASSHFNFGSMVFDGGGDRSHFNPSNSFLPPIEEDSPVFQYFPRRMF